MDAEFGPFLIACLLLGAAGVGKAVDPTMTVGALRGFGLRLPATAVRTAVRVAGAVEAVLASGAIATGGAVLAVFVALSYVVFTVFVAIALARRLPIGSCGCFGKLDTPPSAVHLVVNLGAAASAIAVAGGEHHGIVTVLSDQPLAGIPLLLLAAVGTYAAFTALTVVPTLARVARTREDVS